jgi:DUF2934 family protein/putative transmembrane protein PGPGW
MTESAPVWSTQSSGSLWRTAGGWIFVILGVAGLILPVLPGAPLLIAGLVLLSADHRWAQNCLDKVKLWTQKLYRHQAKPANDYPVMRRPECGPGPGMKSVHHKQPPRQPKESITMKPTQSETELYQANQRTASSHHQQIEARAYELFEQRGREDGRDLDDWLQAESEITMPARSQIRGVAA